MYTWLLWNQGIWREERENNLIIAFHLVPLYLVWHRFLSFTLPEVSGSGSPVDWTNFQSSARVGKKYFPGRAGWGNGSKTGLTTFLTHMQLNPLFSASWHTSALPGETRWTIPGMPACASSWHHLAPGFVPRWMCTLPKSASSLSSQLQLRKRIT